MSEVTQHQSVDVKRVVVSVKRRGLVTGTFPRNLDQVYVSITIGRVVVMVKNGVQDDDPMVTDNEQGPPVLQ